MNIRFVDQETLDIDEAFQWYEDQVTGLGYAFLSAVTDAASLIRIYPEGSSALRGTLRRCMLKRFPYGLIYNIEGEDVIVVAVAHMKRYPKYWHQRI